MLLLFSFPWWKFKFFSFPIFLTYTVSSPRLPFHVKWPSHTEDSHSQPSLWKAHLQIIVIPKPGSHLHPHSHCKHSANMYYVLFSVAHFPVITWAYNTWGLAKSSIIAAAYAPLVKGEQCLKWLTLLFPADLFPAISVTGRRKDCMRRKIKVCFSVSFFRRQLGVYL